MQPHSLEIEELLSAEKCKTVKGRRKPLLKPKPICSSGKSLGNKQPVLLRCTWERSRLFRGGEQSGRGERERLRAAPSSSALENGKKGKTSGQQTLCLGQNIPSDAQGTLGQGGQGSGTPPV